MLHCSHYVKYNCFICNTIPDNLYNEVTQQLNVLSLYKVFVIVLQIKQLYFKNMVCNATLKRKCTLKKKYLERIFKANEHQRVLSCVPLQPFLVNTIV
jgi:tmRNA-binding protein